MFKKRNPETALGTLAAGPSMGLRAQLDQVRARIDKTSLLAQEYNKKLADLSAFNQTLTEAYINNLNIIVDVSGVLNEYKMLMSAVIEQLQSFDSSVSENFKNINVEHIRSLTSDRLRNVSNFFMSPEFSKLKETIASHGRPEAVQKITETEQNFRNIQSRAANTYASLASGCGRGRGRGRGKISRGRGRC